MKTTFAFLLNCRCKMYGRLEDYFKFIFKHKNIPHIIADTQDDVSKYMKDNPDERIIVVYMFSHIIPYGWPVKNASYLIVVLDPEHNLDVGLQDRKAVEQNVYGFVILTTVTDDYYRRYWPSKPIYHFFQGYVPYEDFKYVVDSSNKPVDVVAPGWAQYNRHDRGAIVNKLRQQGLVVDDSHSFGNDLDRAIERAKVYICFPVSRLYGTWHGQRTLWAVNKQICVVTTATQDAICDKFYSKGIFIVTPMNVDIFVNTVLDVVRSGRWKQAGLDGYHTYKQEYDALDLFEGPFYDFCRGLPSTPSQSITQTDWNYQYLLFIIEYIGHPYNVVRSTESSSWFPILFTDTSKLTNFQTYLKSKNIEYLMIETDTNQRGIAIPCWISKNTIDEIIHELIQISDLR